MNTMDKDRIRDAFFPSHRGLWAAGILLVVCGVAYLLHRRAHC